jgi:hypothetical protein
VAKKHRERPRSHAGPEDVHAAISLATAIRFRDAFCDIADDLDAIRRAWKAGDAEMVSLLRSGFDSSTSGFAEIMRQEVRAGVESLHELLVERRKVILPRCDPGLRDDLMGLLRKLNLDSIGTNREGEEKEQWRHTWGAMALDDDLEDLLAKLRAAGGAEITEATAAVKSTGSLIEQMIGMLSRAESLRTRLQQQAWGSQHGDLSTSPELREMNRLKFTFDDLARPMVLVAGGLDIDADSLDNFIRTGDPRFLAGAIKVLRKLQAADLKKHIERTKPETPPSSPPKGEKPTFKQPVRIAAVAKAAGMRSDELLQMVRNRKYVIDPIPRANTAELEQVIAAVPVGKQRQVRKWAKENFGSE